MTKSGHQGTRMTRLVCVALLSTIVTAPAAGQPLANSGAWRVAEISVPTNSAQLPAVDVGNSGRIGFGMFGLKPETARSRAVVVRDVTAPRHRRAGVGLSLKF